MAKKAELKAVLSLNNSAFARTIQNSINLARRFTQQLKANPVKTLGLSALVGAEKALTLAGRAVIAFKGAAVVAYSVIGAKAIQAAANMETVRVGFEVLLGSAQRASERMQQLQGFGNKSPFHFEEIAKGSRMLEILTDGALAGADSLKMIGDVAAGTQREFSETAETIGQLYAALRIGLPIGQQLQSLRNSGAVTDFGSKRIAQISTAGTPRAAAESWKQVTQEFAKFQGMSDKMAGTSNGMASRFQNALQGAFASFGEPLTEMLKPKLEEAIESLLSHKDELAAMGKGFADAIGVGLEKYNSFFFKFGTLLGGKQTTTMGDVSTEALAAQDARNKAQGRSGGLAASMVGRIDRLKPRPVEAQKLESLLQFTSNLRSSKLTGTGFYGLTAGKLGSGLPSSISENPGFVDRLGQGATRSNNFLRFGERRAIENENRAQAMAVRFAAAGYTGNGREAGDTRVRRGDRQRMIQIARESKKKEDEALNNKTFETFMKSFDDFKKKIVGGG